MKKIFIIIIFIFTVLLGIFLTHNKIENFILEKKYSNIEYIEKDFNCNTENSITTNINNFNILLSNFEYNNPDKLNFYLKFSNQNTPLNSVGYILRVYNEDYCLGDRFVGKTSISPKEWILYQNNFYQKTFGTSDNNLLNVTQHVTQVEILENENSLLHKVSFELPKEFTITNNLKITLFDINYQNIGDKNFYKLEETIRELKFNITL